MRVIFLSSVKCRGRSKVMKTIVSSQLRSSTHSDENKTKNLMFFHKSIRATAVRIRRGIYDDVKLKILGNEE